MSTTVSVQNYHTLNKNGTYVFSEQFWKFINTLEFDPLKEILALISLKCSLLGTIWHVKIRKNILNLMLLLSSYYIKYEKQTFFNSIL